MSFSNAHLKVCCMTYFSLACEVPPMWEILSRMSCIWPLRMSFIFKPYSGVQRSCALLSCGASALLAFSMAAGPHLFQTSSQVTVATSRSYGDLLYSARAIMAA